MGKNLYLFVVIGVVTISGFTVLKNNDRQTGYFDEFAKCLANKGIVMYGADWCPHCQNEKKLFGDSFRFVPYVECPNDPQKCLKEGIERYPTWMFKDGKKLIGEQGLEKLSQESECQLPQ